MDRTGPPSPAALPERSSRVFAAASGLGFLSPVSPSSRCELLREEPRGKCVSGNPLLKRGAAVLPGSPPRRPAIHAPLQCFAHSHSTLSLDHLSTCEPVCVCMCVCVTAAERPPHCDLSLPPGVWASLHGQCLAGFLGRGCIRRPRASRVLVSLSEPEEWLLFPKT